MVAPSTLHKFPFRCVSDRGTRDSAIHWCLLNIGECYSESKFVTDQKRIIAEEAPDHQIQQDRLWHIKPAPKGYRFYFVNKRDVFAFSIKFGLHGYKKVDPNTPQLDPENSNA